MLKHAKAVGRQLVVALNHRGEVGIVVVANPDQTLVMARVTAEQLLVDLQDLLKGTSNA